MKTLWYIGSKSLLSIVLCLGCNGENIQKIVFSRSGINGHLNVFGIKHHCEMHIQPDSYQDLRSVESKLWGYKINLYCNEENCFNRYCDTTTQVCINLGPRVYGLQGPCGLQIKICFNGGKNSIIFLRTKNGNVLVLSTYQNCDMMIQIFTNLGLRV